ncbi:MAG TPA: MFS transporter, partial [Polyangiales bacterium]|nr:MFS transporter [Polyangiales bacterium]
MDDRKSFWGYIRHREIDFLPTGALRWWLLGLIVLGWAVEQYEALKNGPVLVYILADFHKSLVEWGQVAAVAGLVYGAGAIILSRLADRVGRRPLMIWPVLAYAAISVLGALTPSFWTLAFLVTAGGFMMAGMNPAVHAASRDLTPQMGRAMVYSWVSLAFTIGALMSTVVAARTLPIWPGWRSQYWIGAGLATVTALLIFIFYRDLSPRVRGQILRTQLNAVPSSKDPAANDAYRDGSAVYKSARLWLLSSVIVFWSLTYITI